MDRHGGLVGCEHGVRVIVDPHGGLVRMSGQKAGRRLCVWHVECAE